MPWLCSWCAIYGKFPLSEAYRPDDEKPVITKDKEKICQTCAKKWYEGKNKAEQENQTTKK
jgi:hypothetical protein